MKIKSKKNLGRLPVYDLSVKDNNQYILENGAVSHNTAATYCPNQIFVISKAQEKTGTEVTGYKFTLNVHKSRFVKEKSKFPFIVDMSKGINQFSSLLDIALELGFVMKPSNGWYSRIDMETGQPEEKKHRAKETETKEFWVDILKSDAFKEAVKTRYQYAADLDMSFEASEDDLI